MIWFYFLTAKSGNKNHFPLTNSTFDWTNPEYS
jgi:hypothetical protein